MRSQRLLANRNAGFKGKVYDAAFGNLQPRIVEFTRGIVAYQSLFGFEDNFLKIQQFEESIDSFGAYDLAQQSPDAPVMRHVSLSHDLTPIRESLCI